MDNKTPLKKAKPIVKAEVCTTLNKIDLQELCDATDVAISAGEVLVGLLHHL